MSGKDDKYDTRSDSEDYTETETESETRDEKKTKDAKKASETESESVSSIGSDDDESGSDDDDDDIPVTKEFQEHVLKYIKADDEIKKMEKKIKALKEIKKPCEEFMIKYLDNVKENIVEINDGKLIKNKTENKVSASEDIIKSAIKKHIANPDIVASIMKDIEERPKKKRTYIKRTYKKKTSK